jgi:predicted HNH restriction endonuclease
MKIEAAYMAGVADSDGSFSISKRKVKTTILGYFYTTSFQLTWKKDAKSLEIMHLMMSKYGGKVYHQKRHDGHFKPESTFLQYQVLSKDLISLINDILPFLKLKQDQAQIVLDLEKSRQYWKFNHKGQGRAKPSELWKVEDDLYKAMATIKGHKIRVFKPRGQND